jgi:carbonic anhydrase/acetyltransferase-like protein (isoleucine patch superfamily)
VNPDLAKLRPYPFERLRLLFKDITPDARHTAINLDIGGVLKPLQANPTIIEDYCFIGARSEIVEENSLVSMRMFIGQRTKIYNRETGEVIYGRVPAGSVVVSGNLPSTDGKYSLYCAVIVKRVDARTREKTASTNCSAANDGIARAQRRVGPLRPTGRSRGPLKGERLCLQ